MELPAFEDPLSVQRILAPSLQWQMLFFYNEIVPYMTHAELLTHDFSTDNLPELHSRTTVKPDRFKSLEWDYRGKRNWKLVCRDFMNEAVEHIFFRNVPTRYY